MIASSLFHFTSKLDTLLLILEGLRFRSSYNVEDVSDFYPSNKLVGIPMICFCDIPLKFISEHPMVYGKYGIGLNKKWGLDAGINPILYRSKNSMVNTTLKETIKAVQNRISSLEMKGGILDSFELIVLNDLTVIQDKILRTTTFSKKYESDDILNYYDREWRYVPKSASIPFLKRHNQRNKLNDDYYRIGPEYLPFKISDIKYIILPTKSDTSKFLKALKMLPFNDDEKFKLSQLAVDLKSISEDF